MEAKILFIVFISIFTVTAIITLLGITNLIKGIREKYLTPLFTALILEVVAAVILLFKNQDFSNSKTIPDIFYQKSAVKQSVSIDKDCYQFIELINNGEKLDSILNVKDEEIKYLRFKADSLSSITVKDFYYYIQQLELLRNSSNGIINLRSNKHEAKKAINIVEQVLILNDRLSKNSNTQEEIISAFAKFKKDNDRVNKSYKIYLQDVPLFVKEYLEENYELKFYISNPNIPTSLTSSSEITNSSINKKQDNN